LEPWHETLGAAKKDLLHRIIKIYPYFILSIIIEFGAYAYGQRPGLRALARWMLNLPSRILFLLNYGFPYPFSVVVWYLSSLFFAIWLLYPIIRRHYDAFTSYVSPILALLIIGFMIHKYGNMNRPDEITLGFVNTGFLRAIAMVSFGASTYGASQIIRKVDFTRLGIFLISAIEVFVYAAIFAYMVAPVNNRNLDGIAILGMAAAFAITLSGKGLLYGKLDSRIVFFLGHFSMTLYLNHAYWFWSGTVDVSSLRGKLVAIALSIVTSFAVLFLGDHLKGLLAKAKSLFVAKAR